MVDVIRLSAFTDGENGGNPAGVAFVDAFPDDAEMLATANQIGYSETAFLFPQPGTESRRWRVRYFAPEAEVPFCGHATIALGAALGEKIGAGKFDLALNNSDITVEAAVGAGGRWTATLTSPATWSRPLSSTLAAEFLRSFGLTPADLVDGVPPFLAHAGATHVVLALKTRQLLTDMKYTLAPMKALMKSNEIVTVNLIFSEADGKTVHSRNAFASGGIYEDPATGAAAAALGGLLRDLGKLNFANNQAEFEVHQGDDMRTPSRIKVSLGPQRGTPIKVSGSVRKIPAPAANPAPAGGGRANG